MLQLVHPLAAETIFHIQPLAAAAAGYDCTHEHLGTTTTSDPHNSNIASEKENVETTANIFYTNSKENILFTVSQPLIKILKIKFNCSEAAGVLCKHKFLIHSVIFHVIRTSFSKFYILHISLYIIKFMIVHQIQKVTQHARTVC